MPKVTEAHLEARRQQILDAAWACFARKGYHQTTVRDICEESELSPGAIYRYFASKEAILEGINDRSQEMGRALVEEARSLAEGPLDTLDVIGRTMWLSYFNDPMFQTTTRVDIEIWPEILRNEALRNIVREQFAFWRTVITELLRQAKELGQLKAEVDPAPLAVLLICAWEGLRHHSLIDPDNFNPERLFELVQTLISKDVPSDTGEAGRKPAATKPSPWPPLGSRPPRGPRGRKKDAGDVRIRK